jgi:hypothetical protein
MNWAAWLVALGLSTGPAIECKDTRFLDSYLPECPPYTVFIGDYIDDSIAMELAIQACAVAERPCIVDVGGGELPQSFLGHVSDSLRCVDNGFGWTYCWKSTRRRFPARVLMLRRAIGLPPLL